MLSRATPRAELFAWHTNAIAELNLRLTPDVTSEPQCGWFKRRLVKAGVFIPARIWVYQPTDEETGDLVGDEVMQCEVNGYFADAEMQWQWLCSHPITEAEFNYLAASNNWAAEFSPNEPKANPKAAVNWLKVPTPIFENEHAR